MENIITYLQDIDKSINILVKEIKKTNELLGVNKPTSTDCYELPKVTKKTHHKGLEVEMLKGNNIIHTFPSMRAASRECDVPFSTLHMYLLEKEPYEYSIMPEGTYLRVKNRSDNNAK